MRIIGINEYDYGSMQLAQPIYDGRKRVLLAAGAMINPKLHAKLIDLGIQQLVVEDAVSQGISLDDMIDMPTWLDVVEVVQNVFESVAAKKSIDTRSVHTAVGKLLGEVRLRPVILLIPTMSVSAELQPYAHAVNVTLLSLQMGKKLGYNDIQMRDLAVGALLHDIGKVVEQDERHADAGFQILKNINEFSLLSAHVAFQHHETLDGRGYPRGIKGSEIIELAQVCGIANLYENLVSLRDMAPHKAMEYVMAYGDKYPLYIINAFVNTVPCYPPGTILQLNNHLDKAIVTRITSHLQRPTVRIVETGEEISLADNPTVMIV